MHGGLHFTELGLYTSYDMTHTTNIISSLNLRLVLLATLFWHVLTPGLSRFNVVKDKVKVDDEYVMFDKNRLKLACMCSLFAF